MRRLLLLLALLAPLQARAEAFTLALFEIAGLLTSAAVIKGILTVAVLVYGSAHARRKARRAQAAAKAAYNASLQDRSITALQSLPPWRIVYGRCITGGDVHAIFTTDKTGYREDGATYTRPDALKHLVVVWADHEVQAINELYIDGVALGPLDGSGYVTSGEFFSTREDSRQAVIGGGGTVSVPQTVTAILLAYTRDGNDFTDVLGGVSGVGTTTISGPAGAYVDYKVQNNLPSVRVSHHLGTSTQTVDTYLNGLIPSQWGSTDRLLNKAYSVITLDLENTRFQGGPPGITADLSGRKVYDPRKDSTVSGGSGAHRNNNAATWEWSDNPALVIRDELTAEWGFESPQADVNDAYTIAAANACDVRQSAAAQSHSQAFTVDASTNEIIFASDEVYGVGDGVRVSTTTTLPSPLVAATTYYIIRQTGLKRYKLATTAANAYAGTAIDITSAGSGTHTCTWHDYATYKANGVISADESKEAVLDDMAESMAGFAVYGAQWEILAGAWASTVMDLTDDDLAGQIELVQADVGMDQLLNGVRGSFIPIGKATPVEFDNYSNSTFVTADGRELWEDRALPYTDSKVRARNLARIFVERGRNGQILRYPAKLRAWPLQRGDRVRVSSTEYGLSLKSYRVTDWQFGGPASPVILTLQEDDSTVYDLSDAASADPTQNTDLPSPWVVQGITLGTPVADETTGRYTSDGTWLPRIHVTWTAVTGAYLADGSGRIVVQWRTDANSDWLGLEVPSNQTGTYIEGVREGAPVLIEVHARNSLGQNGPPSYTSLYVDITGNGVIGGGNQVVNSGFEVDSNADNLADSWELVSASTVTYTYSRPTGFFGAGFAQKAQIATTSNSANDAILRNVTPIAVLPGQQYVLSAMVDSNTGGTYLVADVYDSAGTTRKGFFQSPGFATPGTPRRLSVVFTAPTDGVKLYACVRGFNDVGEYATADDVQLELGTVMTAYAPRADELLPDVVTTTHVQAPVLGESRSATQGSTSITQRIHVPDGFGFNDIVCADSSFVAAAPGVATVTYNGTVDNATAGEYIQFSVQDANGTYGGDLSEQLLPSASGTQAVSCTRQFALAASTTYQFKAYLAKLGTTTVTARQSRITVDIRYTK